MNIYFLVAWLVLIVATGSLAAAKFRWRGFWSAITIPFGPIAFIALACLPRMENKGVVTEKRPWIGGVAGTAACVYIFFCFVGPKQKDDTEASSAVATQNALSPTAIAVESPEQSRKQDAPIKVSAPQLQTDYDANAFAADQEYKGHRLLVSGTVARVSKDFMDDPYISLATGHDESHWVQAGFSKAQYGQLAALHIGTPVTVTCIGKGMVMTTPMLDCR